MADVWGWPGASGTRTVDSHVKALRARSAPSGSGRSTASATPRGRALTAQASQPAGPGHVDQGQARAAGRGQRRGGRRARHHRRRGAVAPWLSIPVTILIALAVTQLLATGMTSPLRQMTRWRGRWRTGDYSGRVHTTSGDEVGELARAFNTMAEDLATVDRQRRELVANVSHELRTPLAALCAVLENLVDGVAEPTRPALQAALDQAERLSRLVGDLLDLSRVDAGVAPLAVESIQVSELLERAVAEARSLPTRCRTRSGRLHPI